MFCKIAFFPKLNYNMAE